MSGLFSPATLEQIRAASDIVEVIGGVLPLKRAGANFVALCPFHKEKSPSFNVNPHKQIFHCFGCHKGGDVFTFIKEYENLSFAEAVRRLAERARIPLEFEKGGGPLPDRSLKESLLQIHEQITQRWQTALTHDAGGAVAREYLSRRGVSAEAVKLFRLGYAPDAWEDTVNWAKSKSHDLGLVEQGGLILRREGSAGYYDRFRGRLIFPICDEQGRVIGFSGRILSGDEKTAKYVNSPETPIFKKGKVFFGLDKSKRALLDAQFAIICEGQLDLMACFMAGVQNVVAPQGTAFTGDHARILKRYVEEVVLCFDSDAAGQNAAVRVLDSLLESGLAVRVATLPAPHDPDSFIKEFGGTAFRQLIEKAEGFFDFYLNRLCATHDVRTDKGQIAIVRAMSEAVHKTGHLVLVDKYAQRTALRLGVSAEATRVQFKKTSRPAPATPDAGEAQPQPESSSRPSPQEFWLLKLVLLHDDLAEWLAAHLNLNWLQHPHSKEIVRLRLEAQEAHSWSGLGKLLSDLRDDAARSLATEAVAEERPIPNPLQQLKDIVVRLRNQALDREMQTLLQRSNGVEMTEADLRRKTELLAAKKQPLTPRTIETK